MIDLCSIRRALGGQVTSSRVVTPGERHRAKDGNPSVCLSASTRSCCPLLRISSWHERCDWVRTAPHRRGGGARQETFHRTTPRLAVIQNGKQSAGREGVLTYVAQGSATVAGRRIPKSKNASATLTVQQ
jgi:hypothetical protein